MFNGRFERDFAGTPCNNKPLRLIGLRIFVAPSLSTVIIKYRNPQRQTVHQLANINNLKSFSTKIKDEISLMQAKGIIQHGGSIKRCV